MSWRKPIKLDEHGKHQVTPAPVRTAPRHTPGADEARQRRAGRGGRDRKTQFPAELPCWPPEGCSGDARSSQHLDREQGGVCQGISTTEQRPSLVAVQTGRRGIPDERRGEALSVMETQAGQDLGRRRGIQDRVGGMCREPGEGGRLGGAALA